MLRDPSNADEHADIYIMMFDLSRMYNVDIGAAVRRKMAINMRRDWRTTETGTLQHTEEDPAEGMYEAGKQDFVAGRSPRVDDEFYMKGYYDAGAENEGSTLD